MLTAEHLYKAIEKYSVSMQLLGTNFPSPVFGTVNGAPAFRHQQNDDLLMSFLKCMRNESLLRSGFLLLNRGFYQEVGIICRCVTEGVEDVFFLAEPLGENGAMSSAQRLLVEEFFQEEFDDAANPIRSQQKRQRVPRDQVLAGIARMKSNPLNPSDAKAVTRMLHHGFSGYVHGAYIHIMELFSAPAGADGNPDPARGRFHVAGRVGGQQLDGMAGAFASRVFQSALGAGMVARRVGNKEVDAQLAGLVTWLSELTGSNAVGDPNKAMKAIKHGKPLIPPAG